jgi:hypothetical protein
MGADVSKRRADQGRLLIGKYTTLGSLTDQKGHANAEVKLDGIEEEKPGLAMKLNPLYKAYGQELQDLLVHARRSRAIAQARRRHGDGRRGVPRVSVRA